MGETGKGHKLRDCTLPSRSLYKALRPGLPRSEKVCMVLARFGNLGLLQCARDHGYPRGWSTCREAALAGHIHVLEWEQENRLVWDKQPCKEPAGGGGATGGPKNTVVLGIPQLAPLPPGKGPARVEVGM